MRVGLFVVLATLSVAGLLVLLGTLLDRIRHIGPDEAFLGWYRGKSDVGGPRMFSGSEYDSMDDHGNRDEHGEL